MWVIYSRSKSNKKIASRAISFFTREKGETLKNVPSHMALVFGERFMLEAVGGAGVRVNFLPTFLKDNEVVEVFEYLRGPDLGLKDGRLLTEGALKYHGRKYDKMGVLWFGIYIIRKWMFGTPLPSKNRWDGDNKFFCSELMEFIEARETDTEDPNSQMKMLRGNQDDYRVLFSKRGGGVWDEFWKPYKNNMIAKSTRKTKKIQED